MVRGEDSPLNLGGGPQKSGTEKRFFFSQRGISRISRKWSDSPVFRDDRRELGVPKPGCFKPGCLQFLRRSALLRPFVLFCALLRTCACALLRSFALFCAHLRVSANDRV